MYPFVRCFCGRPLGHIYELFKALRADAYVAYFRDRGIEIAPDFIPISDNIQVELRDVFAELNVDAQCCKARLMTQVEFTEYY